MKSRLYRSRYLRALVSSALLIVGPVLLGLILRIPSLVYPDDCDIAARCEHAIVEIAASLGFGLIFFGPVLMLLGAIMLVAIGLIWGVRAFRRESSGRPITKYMRKLIGLTCFGLLLFLLYIPNGPDQCSRTITDTQYEICLEGVFSDMTTPEARRWLEESGFRVSRIIEADTKNPHARDARHSGNPAFTYDFHFQAFRDFGKYRSVPYGTNFNRLFSRIWPAPDRFELNVYGSAKHDNVVAVNVWWAFSFL